MADRKGDGYPILSIIGKPLEGIDDILVGNWVRTFRILGDVTNALSTVEG
ncbi:MAG: hypothetical protein RQ728_02660 [Brevefilum sp.]|nr:hypothetical protein [Brevefilum sp.]MDT8381141.1 hypothetical protein [Brevefilum sp.]